MREAARSLRASSPAGHADGHLKGGMPASLPTPAPRNPACRHDVPAGRKPAAGPAMPRFPGAFPAPSPASDTRRRRNCDQRDRPGHADGAERLLIACPYHEQNQAETRSQTFPRPWQRPKPAAPLRPDALPASASSSRPVPGENGHKIPYQPPVIPEEALPRAISV